MMDSVERKKKVLIVDDDPVLRKLMKFGLEKAGYQVQTADHGGQAIERLGQESVDLILVDLMMPVVDGLRFLRWLRQEARASTPALVFTSHDAKDVTDEALATGATDLVIKPVKLPELLERVKRLLT